jgi:hypothetical protein
MNFDKSPYDSVGVGIMAELFKQAEDIYPINDEPTPPKPSLFKRLVNMVKADTRPDERGNCDEEMSTQPSH